MEVAAFWELIDKARLNAGNDYDVFSAYLETELLKMPDDDILAFDKILNQKLIEANHYDLWGAATIINGGCSRDDFEYFRGWLIAQGRNVFEAALKDPDSLAESIDPREDFFEYESILYVANYVYEVKTGKEVPDSVNTNSETAGSEIKLEELSKKFPRLAKKVDPLRFNTE